MARVKFQIRDLGPEPEEVRRIWAPHWEIVRYCEDAGLFQREAQVLILWCLGCRLSQISRVTGIAPSNVHRTLKRAVERVARAYPIRYGGSVLEAWSILLAFRNRYTLKGKGDHGPQLSGTKNRGYREVTSPRLVSVDDIIRDEDPLTETLFRLGRD